MQYGKVGINSANAAAAGNARYRIIRIDRSSVKSRAVWVYVSTLDKERRNEGTLIWYDAAPHKNIYNSNSAAMLSLYFYFL